MRTEYCISFGFVHCFLFRTIFDMIWTTWSCMFTPALSNMSVSYYLWIPTPPPFRNSTSVQSFVPCSTVFSLSHWSIPCTTVYYLRFPLVLHLTPLPIIHHECFRFWSSFSVHLLAHRQSKKQSSFRLPAFFNHICHYPPCLFSLTPPHAPYQIIISRAPSSIRNCVHFQFIEHAFAGYSVLSLIHRSPYFHFFAFPPLPWSWRCLLFSLARCLSNYRRLFETRPRAFVYYSCCRFRFSVVALFLR